MITINGIPVSQGKAIGQVFFLLQESIQYEKVSIDQKSIESEKQKLQTALSKTAETIHTLLQQAKEQDQKEQVEILETYNIMLLDPVLISEIEQYIEKELVTVESLCLLCRIHVVLYFQALLLI